MRKHMEQTLFDLRYDMDMIGQEQELREAISSLSDEELAEQINEYEGGISMKMFDCYYMTNERTDNHGRRMHAIIMAENKENAVRKHIERYGDHRQEDDKHLCIWQTFGDVYTITC